MGEPLQGIPASLVAVDLREGAVTLEVDPTLYPLDAVYGASFTFIDRCFVFLDRDGERIRVTLSAKDRTVGEDVLQALIGEFANELLACAWRAKITETNRATIEAVTMQAIGGAMGPPSLDELEEFDFSEEPFEDPLGIAQSWEDKYGKKGAPAPDAPESKPSEGDET